MYLTYTRRQPITRSAPREGIDYWRPEGPKGAKQWHHDGVNDSPSSEEILLNILIEQPALWQVWKAGKNAQGASRQPQVNKILEKELKGRHGPLARSHGAIGAWVGGKSCLQLVYFSLGSVTPNGARPTASTAWVPATAGVMALP